MEMGNGKYATIASFAVGADRGYYALRCPLNKNGVLLTVVEALLVLALAFEYT